MYDSYLALGITVHLSVCNSDAKLMHDKHILAHQDYMHILSQL